MSSTPSSKDTHPADSPYIHIAIPTSTDRHLFNAEGPGVSIHRASAQFPHIVPELAHVTLEEFIFQEFLGRWGTVEEIFTDNGPAFVSAVEFLAQKYHIHLIRIPPYNSQANGIFERRHYDVREALVKAADGDGTEWPKLK